MALSTRNTRPSPFLSPVGTTDRIAALLRRDRVPSAGPMCRIPPDRPLCTPPPPEAPGLAHVAVTEAELLTFVGRKEVASPKQKAIFDAIIQAASGALWFNKISTNPLQLCHFLGQCCHETARFTALREEAFYRAPTIRKAHPTLADEQVRQFASYRAADLQEEVSALDKKIAKLTASKQDVTTLEKQKAALGDKIKNLDAENRKAQEAYFNWKYGPTGPALGNTQPGDGWRFIGRGFIHLTGRENYQKFVDWYVRQSSSRMTPAVMTFPDLLDSNATLGLQAGVFFWLMKKCDAKAEADDSNAVSRIVNRYDTGTFAKREALTTRAKGIWGAKKPA